MKLSKELLKEIYNFVDEKVKAKIEKEVPEMKPTLEVGKWYKALWNNKNEYLVLIDKILKNSIETNGFNIYENSEYKYLPFAVNYDYKWQLATPEEVETALKNECIRLGIWDNPNIICAWQNKQIKCSTIKVFSINKNEFWGEYGCLFNNGKFATPITEPTQKELLQKQVDELKRQIDLL